jgi:hypothetical protein
MLAGGFPQRADDPLLLARARFGELGHAEVKLLEAALRGEMAWCGPSERYDDPANDPATADTWGPEREIRADLIRWLCIDREATARIDPRGVRMHAAKVVGPLDLSFADVPFPLGFIRCRLTDDADLSCARIPALNLGGTWTQSITAEGIIVQGDVFLRKGFSAAGGVRLLGAQIGGVFACSGGTFNNPGEDALSADGVNVQGAVFLSEGFNVEGAVRLPGAQIGGVLVCSGGTFKNLGKDALTADGVNVKGDVFLREGFSAEGEVWLPGAQVGGQLDCSGGRFKNSGGEALIADSIKVKGTVFLNEGFSAEGKVRLLGAQVEGDLYCNGGTFKDLNAEAATIRGALWWQEVEAGKGTKLNLINATAGAVADDEASWPVPGNLDLDGFVYDRFTVGPRDAKKRLEWLARVKWFRLQPYRQLAKVLRETGDSAGARQVLLEMERRHREQEDRSWAARLWSRVLRVTIGYGLKPVLALGWLLAVTVVGFVVFGLGYLGGAVTPTEKEAYTKFQTDGMTPRHYPRFNALVYSLEYSFPFASLGQKDHWGPNPQDLGCEPAVEWPVLEKLRGVPFFWFPKPYILQVFRLFQIFAGWALATLFVAGLTGIVRAE